MARGVVRGCMAIQSVAFSLEEVVSGVWLGVWSGEVHGYNLWVAAFSLEKGVWLGEVGLGHWKMGRVGCSLEGAWLIIYNNNLGWC